MVKEIQYTNIRRILDELHDESLMENVSLEQVIRYTIQFIGKNGQPKLYQDKVADVEIHEFRGVLPCELVSIIQVKDLQNGLCLRSMTDNFPQGMTDPKGSAPEDKPHCHTPYIAPLKPFGGESSFKTQGRVIFTSFPEGTIQVAYKAIPVDEDGFPLLIDNEVFLTALQNYIILRVLRNKFRKGDISSAVYQDAQQEYDWSVAQLQSEMQVPSVSEMESIARTWNTMIPKMREFDNGFKNLGDREYLRKH